MHKMGTFTLGTSALSTVKRRERRVMLSRSGGWAQVKITNSTKGVPLRLNYITLGYTPLGVR